MTQGRPNGLRRPWMESTVAAHFLSPFRAFFDLRGEYPDKVVEEEHISRASEHKADGRERARSQANNVGGSRARVHPQGKRGRQPEYFADSCIALRISFESPYKFLGRHAICPRYALDQIVRLKQELRLKWCHATQYLQELAFCVFAHLLGVCVHDGFIVRGSKGAGEPFGCWHALLKSLSLPSSFSLPMPWPSASLWICQAVPKQHMHKFSTKQRSVQCCDPYRDAFAPCILCKPSKDFTSACEKGELLLYMRLPPNCCTSGLCVCAYSSRD